MALRNLILRFVFGGVLAALSYLIATRKLPASLAAWTTERFDGIFLAFYAASHFFIFAAVFFVLHQKPWADVVAFYVPQAHAVMHGLVPYRDFESSYAPLNPYLDAALLRLHDSPLTIIIFQIVCDILAVPFWIRFLRRCVRETTVRKAALLYLVQPLVAWEICIDGKNQGLIALLIAIALWSIARREIVSGFSFSLSWILVKILPILFLPTFFFGAHKRWRWLLSATVPSLIVYGAFVLHKADVLSGIRTEGSIATPQNLPYLLGSLTGIDLPPMMLSLVLLAALAGALLVTIQAQLRASTKEARLWKTALGAELVLLVMLLMNKKSDTSYLGMCFFLLCAFVAYDAERAGRAMTAFYASLSFLALPIVSFWYWPLQRESATQLHALLLAGDRDAWIMAAMQALLVLSYMGLAFGILRCVRWAGTEASLAGDSIVALTD